MNYKRFLTYIFCILTVLNCNINYSLAEVHNLTILHTNDVHGRLKSFDYDKKSDVGGFSARAKLIAKFKSENKNLLVLDAGDIAQGTLFFKYFNGVPDVKFMSKVGYDAVEPGNHEFDKGLPVLKKMVESASFPFVCSNIKFSNNPELQKEIKPYIIKDYKDFKVAIIGVISPDLKTLVNNSDCIEALNPVETVKKAVKELDSKVDLIIVLSHEGVAEDIKLAKAVPEINVIVGGHSHTFLKTPEKIYNDGGKSTLIVQDGEFGVDLGYLDLKFENKKLINYDYGLIPVNGKEKDVYFVKKIAELSKKIDFRAVQKIGVIKKPLEIKSFDTKRRLTKSGQLVAEAIKAKFPEVDAVVQNAGGIRGNKEITSGFLTKADVFELYPFENTVIIAEIKGSEVKSILETSSRFLPEGSDAFLQSSGLEYTVNTKESPQILSGDGSCILKEGNRVSDIKIAGRPLLPDKYYKIAVNDFIFNGGNGYSQFKNSKNARKTGIFVQDSIIDFIKKNSPFSIEVEDKIHLY